MNDRKSMWFKNGNMLNYYLKVVNLKFYFDSVDKFKNNKTNLLKYTENENILNNYDKFKWDLAFIAAYTHDMVGIDYYDEIIIDYDNILSFLNLTNKQFETIISEKKHLTKAESDYVSAKLDDDYNAIYESTSEDVFLNTLSIMEENEVFDDIITLIYSDKIEKVANIIKEGNSSTLNDRYIIDGNNTLFIKNNMETYQANGDTRINSHMSVRNFDEQIEKLNDIFAMEKPSEQVLNKIYSSIVLSDLIYTEDKRILSVEHSILKLTYMDAYKNKQTSITWNNYINALDQLSITKGKTKKLVFC